MPFTCYSYLSKAPPVSANRDAGQAARPGLREMPYPCYSYPNMCFSYPGDAPWGSPGPAAAPSARSGLRQVPFGSCFRY
jgi:hypothetical protein